MTILLPFDEEDSMPCSRMPDDIVNKTRLMNVRIGLVGYIRQLNRLESWQAKQLWIENIDYSSTHYNYKFYI